MNKLYGSYIGDHYRFPTEHQKSSTYGKTEIPDEIETQVDANISKFKRALNTAKAMAQRWRGHTVEIDGNNNPIKRAIAVVRKTTTVKR